MGRGGPLPEVSFQPCTVCEAATATNKLADEAERNAIGDGWQKLQMLISTNRKEIRQNEIQSTKEERNLLEKQQKRAQALKK